MVTGEAEFRPDIEGLRAVAVTGVLVFHLSPGSLPGGFVGVDVFFVISGFLITGGIIGRLRKGSFSFGDFYARRLRRLLPAYLVMLLAVYLAGSLLQLPTELDFLGKTAISSVLYVSNILFMRTDGYFSEALATSPLLHTWSLSVEEQFYLVFPALLSLVFLYLRRYLVAVLVLLAAASFAFAVHLASYDDAWAFFASPTRFWQFLAGSLLVLVAGGRPAPIRWLAEGLTLFGLAAIAATYFWGSSATSFPTVISLPPTLGAVAIIAAGGVGGASRLLLCNPLSRFLGRISYSLYLWHWPIVVFYALRYGPSSPSAVIVLLAASIAAGWLSTRFVEQPFRSVPLLPRRRIFAGAALGSGIAVATGALLMATGGLPGRFSPDQVRIASYMDYDPVAADEIGYCFLRTDQDKDVGLFDEESCLPDTGAPKRIALVGDSHAHQYARALRVLWPDADVSIIAATGCRPLLHGDGNPTCRELMERAFDQYLPDGHYDDIILAARWRGEEIDQLKETVADMRRGGARLTVVGPVIEYRSSLPRLIAFDRLEGADTMSEWSRLREKTALDDRMAEALSGLDVSYVSVLKTLCPGGTCRYRIAEDEPMQFDYGHLTYDGSLIVLEDLRSRGFLAGDAESATH